MSGYVSLKDYKGDDFPFGVPNDGLKTPLGGALVTYIVTGKAPAVPAPTPSYTISESKSVEENFTGAKRQAALDYFHVLLSKGKLDHLQSLLTASLEEYKDDLDFLKVNLSYKVKAKAKSGSGTRILLTVIINIVAENLQAVVEAATSVENNIDATALALFYGTLHEDTDPEIKKNNERKEALLQALNEKALALHQLYKVSF